MARIICSFGLVGYAYIYPVYCSVSKGCIVVCSFLFLQPRYRGPSRVIELAADTFESLVLSCKDKVWIIEFYLTWSDNVKHFEPLLAKLSLEYSNNNNTLCFGRFNVSRYPTIGAKYGIDLNTCSKMIPTLVVFERGREKRRVPYMDERGNVYPKEILRMRKSELVTALHLDYYSFTSQ
eukprot:jgi/Galph1/2221/GphlegSOOS_G915.1